MLMIYSPAGTEGMFAAMHALTQEQLMNAELTRHALFRERFGGTPTSLVFPRNQVAFLAMYHAQGISAWRDNESPWYYQLARHTNHPVVRGLRMMDALAPWRARGGSFTDGRTPSTLFVRVYLPEGLWKLHLARIVSEARRVKQGSVLHFWLHPHNLGADVPRGIRRLEQVFDAIGRHAPHGTICVSMRDLVSQESGGG